MFVGAGVVEPRLVASELVVFVTLLGFVADEGCVASLREKCCWTGDAGSCCCCALVV